jgi:1-aminocyclopropane-1-carboxylate deaminase
MKAKASLLSRLDATPVMGVSLAAVSLLRLDLCGGNAPGNKWFKLQENITDARKRGINTVVSFGGAWSNHLHALAATGRELGLQTIGIVRGEEPANPSPMLQDAKSWGMQLVYVSRQEYRMREERTYIEKLQSRFDPCLVIPEGGANLAGVEGCEAIADLLVEEDCANSTVVLAVGTGTTLAGIARGLGANSGANVVGVSVLKGAHDLDNRVAGFTGSECAPWRILHEHHCGGYARVSPALREFILAFQAVHNIPLDPVYTGKALFAVHQLCATGQWRENQPVVLVHTGGLQGRRGFDWLS